MYYSKILVGILAIFSLHFLASADTSLFAAFPDTSGNIRFNSEITYSTDTPEGLSWADQSEVVPINGDVVYTGVTLFVDPTLPIIYVFYTDDHPNTIPVASYNTYFDSWSWNYIVGGPTDINIISGVSAVFYESNYYLFYAAEDEVLGGALWVTYGTDISRLSDSVQVPNTGITGTPAAVVFESKIYVFHEGNDDNTQLWYNTYSGSTWAGDQWVDGATIGGGLSAIVIGTKVWIFHQGWDGSEPNGELYFITFDGTSWSDDTAIQADVINADPDSVPTAINLGDYIFLFTTLDTDGSAIVLDLNGNPVTDYEPDADDGYFSQTIGIVVQP